MSISDYAEDVVTEAQPVASKLWGKLRDRAKARDEALRLASMGAELTQEQLALTSSPPPDLSDEARRRLLLEVENQVAARLTAEARAEQARQRAELQSKIDALTATNVAAADELPKVDAEWRPKVEKARQLIATWQQERQVVLTGIATRERQVQALAAQSHSIPCVDHIGQLAIRRRMSEEQTQRAVDASIAARFDDGLPDAERRSIVNPPADASADERSGYDREAERRIRIGVLNGEPVYAQQGPGGVTMGVAKLG